MKFRLVAFDETSCWHVPLPEGMRKVYGVYVFCEGERTYCASMIPSSWCEFIENEFVGAEPPQDTWYYCGDSTYMPFIDPEKLSNFVSRAVECDDWEDAIEYFQDNRLMIPCLMENEEATA